LQDHSAFAARLPGWLKQAAKFGSVGVLNTLLDLALYFVLTRWLGLGDKPTFAKGISYSVGVLNSYFLNRVWTFRVSDSSSWAALLPFVLSSLVGLAINTGMLDLCLKTLALPELIAIGIATASSLLWNFLVSKFLIFRK
jgi:putative flippase GtrA